VYESLTVTLYVRIYFDFSKHSFQYTCYYANTEEGNYQSILATDKQPVSLCEFRSAEKVKCSAKAINNAGESPVTSQTGYTKIAGYL